VDIRDAERGEVSYTLFSVAEDTDLTFTEDRFYSAAFAVDSAFHVYLSCVELDGDTPPFTYTRTTWCYAPYLPEVAQTVTLTITAPYQVEAVASSVRMYQRSHPEVEVVWDVAYASREEFQKHSAQYAEQLALRLMTGDVGDILMLHGTGLDVDAVLQTDALADLSDDLAACSFRDDLEDSVLDSLREESGAIRALPVAISPQYLVYNETLAQQLGLTWDEEDLTWSELLDLAQQWQADDSPYSLFWSDRDYDNVDLLYGLLLANLESFAQADGSVDLSWLGGQLEQLKALQGSQQLKSDFDGFWWDAGSFDHTLLMELSGADYTELLVDLKLAEENNGVTLKLVSMPRGDQTEARQSYAFCWGISAVSAQKDAAWSFLEFLISQDGLVSDTYFTETCLLNQAADRERFEQTVKMTADYVDGVMQIENEERHYEQFRALLAHPISRLAEPTRWKSAIYTPLSQYMDGTLELSQALAQASDAWQRVLAE
jgi:ABC-type glycerol-3-phosphate transport system substrate-binding protein